eukprot:m.283662 g.283662  ORF g.283662 m.283662 type:complete len:229 (-) comp166713_c0_seq1:129-815(-)
MTTPLSVIPTATPSLHPDPLHVQQYLLQSGDHYTFDLHQWRPISVRTDGIGCCVVLALRGQHKESLAREAIVAHIDSQQYCPPGVGGNGKTDAELEHDDDIRQENRAGTVKALRKFVREHRQLHVLAATNYLHYPIKVDQCLSVKFGITPCPTIRYLGDESIEGGCVVFNVDVFQMYKADRIHGTNLNIQDLPTLMEASIALREPPPRSIMSIIIKAIYTMFFGYYDE